MILWSILALAGCAAFVALGVWAHRTDESYRAHKRALAAEAVPVPVLVQVPVQVPAPAVAAARKMTIRTGAGFVTADRASSEH